MLFWWLNYNRGGFNRQGIVPYFAVVQAVNATVTFRKSTSTPARTSSPGPASCGGARQGGSERREPSEGQNLRPS